MGRQFMVAFIVAVLAVWMILIVVPAMFHPLAGSCQATSCKVIPCSTSMSAENSLHTPDDAIAPQQWMPAGCDDTMGKVP